MIEYAPGVIRGGHDLGAVQQMARTFITIDLESDTWHSLEEIASKYAVSPEVLTSFLLEQHFNTTLKGKQDFLNVPRPVGDASGRASDTRSADSADSADAPPGLDASDEMPPEATAG